LNQPVAALCTGERHSQKNLASRNFNVRRSRCGVSASDQLSSPSQASGDPQGEAVTAREEDADLDLADSTLRFACVALAGIFRYGNQLIVGPLSGSSKVLRDTIGERFLRDQKGPLFVNEFVPRHCCSRTQIVTSKIRAREFLATYPFSLVML